MPLPGRNGTGVGLVCFTLCYSLSCATCFTRDTLSCCLIVNLLHLLLWTILTVLLLLGRPTEGSQHLGGSQEKSLSLRQYPLSYSLVLFPRTAWCSGWPGPDSPSVFGSATRSEVAPTPLHGLGTSRSKVVYPHYYSILFINISSYHLSCAPPAHHPCTSAHGTET
jgi:hypothetical protein